MRRALIVGACSLIVAGCAGSSGSSTGTTTTPASPAQELAGLQEGGTPGAGDPLVASFQSALSALQGACTESPSQLGGEIYTSWKDLEKNNRPTTLLHVAQALDTITSGLTSNSEPTSCASLLAAYLVTAEAPGGQP